MPDDDPLLSPEDVQRFLQISAETVRRRIRDGTLRAYRDGGSVSFKKSEVMNALEPYAIKANTHSGNKPVAR